MLIKMNLEDITSNQTFQTTKIFIYYEIINFDSMEIQIKTS